ncbi:hypothetical protein [Saccharicrinis carchari]|nr:hypothetical protein [Saccharicrinis carchari]
MLCFQLSTYAQPAIEMSGYITEMPSYRWQKTADKGVWDNLIHNRINLKYNPKSNLNFTIALRNRFFLGETVRNNPLYKYYMDNDQGWVDMSFNWGTGKAYVVNTIADRLFVEHIWGNIKIKAGRQRVVWGQSRVWNANDLFNPYSFYDFDYPERPGMDGLSLKYLNTGNAKLEAVLKVDGNKELTSALLYGFSKSNYYFQFIAGQLNQSYFVMGSGWKINFKHSDFYGEFSYLSSFDQPKPNIYMLSTGSAYTINHSIKLSGEYLYASNLNSSFSGFDDLSFSRTSVQKLSISKHSYNLALSLPINPQFHFTFDYTGFAYPVFKNYYISPTIEYALKESLHLSGILQLFSNGNTQPNQMIVSTFIRLKKVF